MFACCRVICVDVSIGCRDPFASVSGTREAGGLERCLDRAGPPLGPSSLLCFGLRPCQRTSAAGSKGHTLDSLSLFGGAIFLGIGSESVFVCFCFQKCHQNSTYILDTYGDYHMVSQFSFWQPVQPPAVGCQVGAFQSTARQDQRGKALLLGSAPGG